MNDYTIDRIIVRRIVRIWKWDIILPWNVLKTRIGKRYKMKGRINNDI